MTAAKDSLGLTQWIFFMLWPSINYVVFPTVQTLTSDGLRENAFGCCMMGCFNKCSCGCGVAFSKLLALASCKCCRGKSGEGVATGVEQIEMNGLKNSASPV